MTTPANTSLWPAKYLVTLWITRSMPYASGCRLSGVAKVLSMAVRTRRRWPISPRRARSRHRMNGLVGDSEKIRRVVGRIAASTASRSPAGVTVTSIP